MNKEDILKYIGYRVYIVLSNGFEYKLLLKPEYVKNDTISFLDKYNNPVDFSIQTISFITISKPEKGKNDRN